MAYSLRVASCFLVCASAIQDVVHLHRQASQFLPNNFIDNIVSKAENAVDKVVDTTNDVASKTVKVTNDVASKTVKVTNDVANKAVNVTNDASGLVEYVLGSVDGYVNELDAIVHNDTTLFHAAGQVNNVFASHTQDMLYNVMINGNPTGFRPLNAALESVALLVNDTTQRYGEDVQSLQALVTDELKTLSAEGLVTAQTALTKVESALEPLREIGRTLNVTKEALAVSADPVMDAISVQAPLQEAIAAAEKTLTELSQENSTLPEIKSIFDTVLEEASSMPAATMSPERLEEVDKATHKFVADSTKLVTDVEALATAPLKDVIPAMQTTKDVALKVVNGESLNPLPSAAEGSRFFSAAVGGVVLMALTAVTA